jgi:hypothetical protein
MKAAIVMAERALIMNVPLSIRPFGRCGRLQDRLIPGTGFIRFSRHAENGFIPLQECFVASRGRNSELAHTAGRTRLSGLIEPVRKSRTPARSGGTGPLAGRNGAR